ncbi:MAG TPA: 3-deoxy-manno-octulosonate cytidylyltransferase [Sphingobacteriaceae bacterium]|nr:3-deoxy-manno-octulosonate cytidylyltransferase [Sphingobacteriaceae bacterium]
MRIFGLIPARYPSTRFPGKPLIDIGGKSMIRRVYEQAKKASSLTDVIVATDDDRILSHVIDFGGNAVMTSDQHQSGTDRCAEVASKLPDMDVIINIQGDDPFIDPKQIDLLCTCFEDPETVLATLAKKIDSREELFNPNIPKVIFNTRSEAIYFSRTPIPYLRDKDQSVWQDEHQYYKHLGIYGYKTETLQKISKLPVSLLEKAEALEQLRWIENGYSIRIAVTELESFAIDTPDDLQRLLNSSIDL